MPGEGGEDDDVGWGEEAPSSVPLPETQEPGNPQQMGQVGQAGPVGTAPGGWGMRGLLSFLPVCCVVATHNWVFAHWRRH